MMRIVPVVPRRWWKGGWFVAPVAVLVGIAIGATGRQTPAASPTVHVTDTVSATVTAHPRIVKVIATRTRTVTVTYTPPPPPQYGEGTYVVGTDIQPGVYKTAGSPDGNCYWARLASLDTSDIVDNSTSGGPQTIQIAASDRAFQVQGDCRFGRVG